jgi:pyruvate formate lyase activating enzyme
MHSSSDTHVASDPATRPPAADEGRGLVFDVKRFALHDGPGIRTTAFLKGCPLSCVWCQNPEGISPQPHLWYHSERCIRCRRCISTCPNSALSAHPDDRHFIHIDRSACTLNGACVRTCPSDALTWDSESYTVNELVDLFERDRLFYENSNGGITLSGGEPLFQKTFAVAVLEECVRRGLHTTLESTLFLSRATLERALPFVDHFLTDVKLWDSKEHKKHTGVPNEQILENVRFLAGTSVDMTIRVPLIPGITATEQNVGAVARFVAGLPADVPLELVNFNPLPAGKYRVLGIRWPFQNRTSPLSKSELEPLERAARAEGVRLVEE